MDLFAILSFSIHAYIILLHCTPWTYKVSCLNLFSHSVVSFCDSMNCSPTGSSVHGILQARTLESVALPFCRGSSQPRDLTCVSYFSCVGRQVLYHHGHHQMLARWQFQSKQCVKTNLCVREPRVEEQSSPCPQEALTFRWPQSWFPFMPWQS